MPRMTRAALKAQAQTDEYPDLENNNLHAEKELELQSALIHEDAPKQEIGETRPETDIHSTTDDLPVRLALRDITDENYPKADLISEAQSQSPVTNQELPLEQDIQKSTRKPRAKAKGRTKKKVNTPTVVEPEEEDPSDEPELEAHSSPVEYQNDAEIKEENSQQSQEEIQEVKQSRIEEDHTKIYEEISEPGPAIEDDEEEEQYEIQSPFAKTPRFSPTLHLPDEDQTRPEEDSFVNSITSRSPSKFGLSVAEPSETVQADADSLHTFTPLRRTSSTKFEESFEALDCLEDNIEQLTAGIPLLRNEEMQSPDSPVKPTRRSVRIGALPSTPKMATTPAPRSTSSKPRSVLKLQDKENTPPIARTPLQSKTPLAPKTFTPKEATPLKSRTPAVRHSSPLKDGTLSIKKSRIQATKAVPEVVVKKPTPATTSSVAKTSSPTKAARKSTMITSTTTKAPTITKKPMSTLQRKPSQKQPSMAPAANKTVPTSRKSIVPAQLTSQKPHQTSASVSAAAAQQQPTTTTHQRRVTSGGILSTSKPGFIPSKSSKPPTTSSFALPGDAIAEKLKAQKEAREEKMRQPKVNLAEQKAAKLKADREAREERVRLNQIKAREEAEEKENRKPMRPVSMSAITISKARAEAAERGRLASKEWAERKLKKIGEGKGEDGLVEAV